MRPSSRLRWLGRLGIVIRTIAFSYFVRYVPVLSTVGAPPRPLAAIRAGPTEPSVPREGARSCRTTCPPAAPTHPPRTSPATTPPQYLPGDRPHHRGDLPRRDGAGHHRRSTHPLDPGYSGSPFHPGREQHAALRRRRAVVGDRRRRRRPRNLDVSGSQAAQRARGGRLSRGPDHGRHLHCGDGVDDFGSYPDRRGVCQSRIRRLLLAVAKCGAQLRASFMPTRSP